MRSDISRWLFAARFSETPLTPTGPHKISDRNINLVSADTAKGAVRSTAFHTCRQTYGWSTAFELRVLFVCLSREGTEISCVSGIQNLHFAYRMNVRVSCDCHNSSCTTLTSFAAAYAWILTDWYKNSQFSVGRGFRLSPVFRLLVK